MNNILTVLLICLALAIASDYVNYRRKQEGNNRKEWFFTIAIIVVLSLYGGLRTQYNDTAAYIWAYRLIDGFNNIDSRDMSIGSNPGFYILNAIFRTFTDDYHIFLLSITTFIQTATILFFRKYSNYMALTVMLYIMSGTYGFTLAAIKQCLAVALCLIAIHFLFKKKWLWFVVFILIAITIHPYSFLFFFVPLLLNKPWTNNTYLILLGAILVPFLFSEFLEVMLGFTEVIGEGFTEENFSGGGVNIFRVLVYGVPVALSFIYKDSLYEDSTKEENLFANATVLSFALMFIGLFGTANLFARLANYFNLFMYISLPLILMKNTTKLKEPILYAAIVGYTAFYYYGYYINIEFDRAFGRITLWEYLQQLF